MYCTPNACPAYPRPKKLRVFLAVVTYLVAFLVGIAGPLPLLRNLAACLLVDQAVQVVHQLPAVAGLRG